MSCRCSEISKCNRDITTLGQMIQQLTQLRAEDTKIKGKLENLGDASYTAITPRNILSLVSYEEKLNDPISRLRKSMLGDCIDEKRRLEGICKSMQNEDNAYHKEEEEKKKNNQ